MLSVGEIKADKDGKFKKCFATIETMPKINEFSEEVYSSEPFEIEVPLKKDSDYGELKILVESQSPFPAVFNLRGFKYQESGKEKHGKSLQLKKWTR